MAGKQQTIIITDRQREVLDLVSRGISDKAIAEELGLSHPTIRKDIHAAMTSNGTATRTELVATLIREGEL